MNYNYNGQTDTNTLLQKQKFLKVAFLWGKIVNQWYCDHTNSSRPYVRVSDPGAPGKINILNLKGVGNCPSYLLHLAVERSAMNLTPDIPIFSATALDTSTLCSSSGKPAFSGTVSGSLLGVDG